MNLILRCGLRGGYTEMHNVPREMREVVLKLKGLDICSNIIGQLAVN